MLLTTLLQNSRWALAKRVISFLSTITETWQYDFDKKMEQSSNSCSLRRSSSISSLATPSKPTDQLRCGKDVINAVLRGYARSLLEKYLLKSLIYFSQYLHFPLIFCLREERNNLARIEHFVCAFTSIVNQFREVIKSS
jgi:hypothetical protein